MFEEKSFSYFHHFFPPAFSNKEIGKSFIDVCFIQPKTKQTVCVCARVRTCMEMNEQFLAK